MNPLDSVSTTVASSIPILKNHGIWADEKCCNEALRQLRESSRDMNITEVQPAPKHLVFILAPP